MSNKTHIAYGKDGVRGATLKIFVSDTEKEVKENGITVSHMLNDKKYMNSTTNMAFNLKKDLRFSHGSGHWVVLAVNYCKVLERALSESWQKVLTPDVDGCDPLHTWWGDVAGRCLQYILVFTVHSHAVWLIWVFFVFVYSFPQMKLHISKGEMCILLNIVAQYISHFGTNSHFQNKDCNRNDCKMTATW